MKIKKLALTNYRRFDGFDLDFDEHMTVLVARNGAGKTTILDAVATALGSFITRLPGVSGMNPDKDRDLRIDANGAKSPYMRIACESFDGVRWDRTERRDQSKKTAEQIPRGEMLKRLYEYVDRFIDADNGQQSYELPVFIYYGTGRGVFDVPQRKRAFSKEFTRFGALDQALHSRTTFKRFVEYFYFLEEREHRQQKEARSFDVQIPELRAIRLAVQQVLPEFSNPRGVHPAGIQLDWQRDQETHTLRIEQFSDGFRTTLAMVMDIAARMAEANPDKEDVLQTTGIVLIDEVDLHLHPGWQQQILLDLEKTFPNIQFIVTTHSPQVISSVRPESLRVIEWDGEHALLRPVDFSLGAESQQMLQDVLGVTSTRPDVEIVQTLRQYQRFVADDKWDSDEALTLRRQLDEWGREHDPELARLEMDIRLKALDRSA